MFTIDYQDRRPIYEQIVESCQMMIIRGILAPDEQLPSVRQTAIDLAVNPNTVQKAYAILEREGYVYSVKGRGSFVSPDRAAHEKKRLVFEEKLRTLVREGIGLGIDEEACLAAVSDVYRAHKEDET